MAQEIAQWKERCGIFILIIVIFIPVICGDARSNSRRRQCTWLCPCVRCPTISPRCSKSESIVFQREFLDEKGNVVEVRCESCRYCLDTPATTLSKRSLRSHLVSSGTKQDRRSTICSNEHICPNLPQNCDDVRQTQVFLGGNFCRHCPACYDFSILKQLID